MEKSFYVCGVILFRTNVYDIHPLLCIRLQWVPMTERRMEVEMV